MLEIRNLKKIYSTTGGEKVRALDGVSIQFPEKGLVFLLGKSGSGKSTMLNLLGGLDKPDEGEIIVDGCNSKDFTQSDFDNYRNTYVGIVFQEFNILNEFSVGTNISIALQLQNKHNDKKAVENILNLVELDGMADRKPETLSGGQKQRVAIARAIIKDPEIVLADEPTGALDSKTGEQIFNTLKKLSSTRLVVVVSHDRDSAEKYADRIIELADGRVINDVVKSRINAEKLSENVDVIGDSTIKIKDVSKISTAELENIVERLKGSNNEAILTFNQNVEKVKKVCKINKDGNMDGFSPTPEQKPMEENGSKASFLKAKFPIWHAIKLGASSFKKNTVRFIITILLSVVAFCVFGAVTTLIFYKPNYSFSRALQEMNYQSLLMDKFYLSTKEAYTVREDWTIDEANKRVTSTRTRTLFGEEEIRELNKNNVGLDFAGVFTFNPGATKQTRTFNIYGSFDEVDYQNYYEYRYLTGFTDCGEQFMKDNGFICHGRYPKNATEIAVSQYIYEVICYQQGFLDEDNKPYPVEAVLAGVGGLKVTLNATGGGVDQMNLNVVGVYEISDYSKYDQAKNRADTSISSSRRSMLLREFKEVLAQSMDLIGFVSADFYETYVGQTATVSDGFATIKVQGFDVDSNTLTSKAYYTDVIVSEYPNKFNIFDADGKEININNFVLNEDEIFVSYSKWENHRKTLKNMGYSEEKVAELMKQYTLTATTFKNQVKGELELKVKGYFKLNTNGASAGSHYLVAEDTLRQHSWKRNTDSNVVKDISSYKVPLDAKYNYAISMSENTLEQVEFLLKDDGLVEYKIVNSAYDRIFGSEVLETMENYKRIFLIVGAVTGVFSALMIMNFITTSINSKRKEIGILRAVGAGKSDIFRIFFTETFLLALISFILASVGAGFITVYVNKILYQITFTHLLQYGIINVLSIFVISVFISFASTVFPVYKEAMKLPVNSIRQL